MSVTVGCRFLVPHLPPFVDDVQVTALGTLGGERWAGPCPQKAQEAEGGIMSSIKKG